MHYTILRGFCIGPGIGDAIPGENRDDIPPGLIVRLLSQGKIRALPSGNAADVLAQALAQSRAELLQQIAAAQSVEELEKLLTEDPEIAEAYEQRLSTLEDQEPPNRHKSKKIKEPHHAS